MAKITNRSVVIPLFQVIVFLFGNTHRTILPIARLNSTPIISLPRHLVHHKPCATGNAKHRLSLYSSACFSGQNYRGGEGGPAAA